MPNLMTVAPEQCDISSINVTIEGNIISFTKYNGIYRVTQWFVKTFDKMGFHPVGILRNGKMECYKKECIVTEQFTLAFMVAEEIYKLDEDEI